MDNKSIKENKQNKRKGIPTNNFDDVIKKNKQQGKDLLALYEIFQEIGLPEESDQIE
ncbi:MAG: hypothetical protein WC872_03365 [Candidatus Absconditabacterales bacterium]